MKTNFWSLAMLLAVAAATPAWAQTPSTGLVDLTANRLQPSIRLIADGDKGAPGKDIFSEVIGAPSCGGGCEGSCGGGCNGCCDMGCCDSCVAPWAHRTGLFAEFLYLNAQDVEMPYGVIVNGPITGTPPPTPIQISPYALTDPDYDPGFRAGFVYALCDDASIVATYTHFETDDGSSISIANPGTGQVLRNLTSHPQTFNAGTDFLSATAFSDIDFDLVDVDYRSVIACGDLWALNVVVGARYAQLNQHFTTTFTEQISETVESSIEFDGAGARIGFDGEKHAACSGMFVYGKSLASFTSGNFRATYNQSQSTAPNLVDTAWTAGRVVSMLDLEMGAGWQSCCGTYRLSAGYVLSGWYNVVKTDDWVRAVQTNNLTDLGSDISFDGLTAKVEVRW